MTMAKDLVAAAGTALAEQRTRELAEQEDRVRKDEIRVAQAIARIIAIHTPEQIQAEAQADGYGGLLIGGYDYALVRPPGSPHTGVPEGYTLRLVERDRDRDDGDIEWYSLSDEDGKGITDLVGLGQAMEQCEQYRKDRESVIAIAGAYEAGKDGTYIDPRDPERDPEQDPDGLMRKLLARALRVAAGSLAPPF